MNPDNIEQAIEEAVEDAVEEATEDIEEAAEEVEDASQDVEDAAEDVEEAVSGNGGDAPAWYATIVAEQTRQTNELREVKEAIQSLTAMEVWEMLRNQQSNSPSSQTPEPENLEIETEQPDIEVTGENNQVEVTLPDEVPGPSQSRRPKIFRRRGR